MVKISSSLQKESGKTLPNLTKCMKFSFSGLSLFCTDTSLKSIKKPITLHREICFQKTLDYLATLDNQNYTAFYKKG